MDTPHLRAGLYRYYYSYLDYKNNHCCINCCRWRFQTVLKNVFPELQRQLDFVTKVIREEDAFLRTLEKGLKRIDDIIKSSQCRNLRKPGYLWIIWYLWFPIDLTRLIASENKLKLLMKPVLKKHLTNKKTAAVLPPPLETEDCNRYCIMISLYIQVCGLRFAGNKKQGDEIPQGGSRKNCNKLF